MISGEGVEVTERGGKDRTKRLKQGRETGEEMQK